MSSSSDDTGDRNGLQVSAMGDDKLTAWLERRRKRRNGHHLAPEPDSSSPTDRPAPIRTVDPTIAELMNAPEAATLEEVAASAPEPVVRRTVWVVRGDPAVDHPETADALAHLGEAHDVQVIDPPRSAAWLSEPSHARRVPDVLVFGDLHALLENPVVAALADHPRVRRLLLSTHRNADLLEAATAFCAVDEHLVLPECSPGLASQMSDFTSRPHLES